MRCDGCDPRQENSPGVQRGTRLIWAIGLAVANLLVSFLSSVTSISSIYSGQLRCSSVHSPSGSALETDAPTDNQGKGERFSPTDLVATALNPCILTIMGIVAERHGWDLKGCAARVEKVMTSEAPRKIALLEVWIELPPHIDSKARRILEKAAENCPVKMSLDGAVPMRFHWS